MLFIEQDAGLPEAEVEMLKIAGLLSLGKLEEAAKLSEFYFESVVSDV